MADLTPTENVTLRQARVAHSCAGDGAAPPRHAAGCAGIAAGDRYAEYVGETPAYQSGSRHSLRCAREFGLVEPAECPNCRAGDGEGECLCAERNEALSERVARMIDVCVAEADLLTAEQMDRQEDRYDAAARAAATSGYPVVVWLPVVNGRAHATLGRDPVQPLEQASDGYRRGYTYEAA